LYLGSHCFRHGCSNEAMLNGIDSHSHPEGAAGSLREGLAETFTVARLGVAPTLARTLWSTNAVESMIEICRDHGHNVKPWDGAAPWRCAGARRAYSRRRSSSVGVNGNGHLHLKALHTALNEHVGVDVTPPV
jgi:putative transposase